MLGARESERNENTIPALQESVLQFISVIRVQITEATIPKTAAGAGPCLLSQRAAVVLRELRGRNLCIRAEGRADNRAGRRKF